MSGGNLKSAAQYDAIAQEYQRTKESPLRRHVEAYSFFRMLGDVAGLTVLDLACGEGFYTRLIKRAGAATVAGVDISAEMIALAEADEREQPLGIEYFCNDVARLPDLAAELLPGTAADLSPDSLAGMSPDLSDLLPDSSTTLSPNLPQFDVVTAAYLLHYAPDQAQLQAMCRRIASQLKPGGRLVCINENPDQSAADYAGYTQYGFNKSVAEPRREGSPITYAMVSGRKLIRFNAYYYSRATYEAALRAAGFRHINWQPLELSPEGIAECGPDYWQEYLANPPVTGLECQL